jgi:hypothetical protein
VIAMSWFLGPIVISAVPAFAADPPPGTSYAPPAAAAAAPPPTATETPLPVGQTDVDATRRAAAETRYLEGLSAWKRRDWDGSLAGARAAVSLDPELDAAYLLEGYSLLRLGRAEEGVAVLRGLADAGGDDATSREVRRRAGVLERRISDRWRRDQV